MTTILIVDGDQLLLDVVANLLTRRGYACLGTRTVSGAISIVETAPVDMIGVDVFLEDGSGSELINWVNDNSPAVPVVLASGSESIEVHSMAKALGAWGGLRKPYVSTALYSTVERCVGKAKPKQVPPLRVSC